MLFFRNLSRLTSHVSRLTNRWTAFVSILQECFPLVPHVRIINLLVCQHSFSIAC